MTSRPRALAPEARAQIAKIRAGARRGLSVSEIAEFSQSPVEVVKRVLEPANHERLSRPADLLPNHSVSDTHAPAALQLYWIGFLTAAGRITGQGTSMATIITLGDRAEAHMARFADDIVGSKVRQEYCQSSLGGWQVYIREPNLCHALVPWGVLSDFHGEDAELLDDIPSALAAPFVAGYLDGNWPASSFPRAGRLTLYGTPGVLSALSRLLRRCCGIPEGKVAPQPPRAKLKYPSLRVDQEIWSHARPYAFRRP